jgi:hypothetical protein
MVDQPSAQSSPSRLRRAYSLTARNWDLLVLLFFVSWQLPHGPSVISDISQIDANWHVDEVFKLSRGVWIGPGVSFTHGPLFQWISALPSRLIGVSFGTIYQTWITLPLCCGFFCVYLTIRLLLPELPSWKRALLLILAFNFWLGISEWSLPITIPILLFAVFLRGWYAVDEARIKSYLLGIAAAALCVLGFLIASDAGVYSVAAWAIVTIAIFLEGHRDKRATTKCVEAVLAFGMSFGIFALAVNAAMGDVFNFRFWKDGAQTLSVYRWATPGSMSPTGAAIIFGSLLGGAAIFVFHAMSRSGQNRRITERTAFLLGGYIFAMAMLQTALVRSDNWHVQIASFATMILSGVVLFSIPSRKISLAVVFVAAACSVLILRPLIQPRAYVRMIRQFIRQPKVQCPDGFLDFDRGCLTPESVAMLQNTSEFLDQHSEPQQSIVVFPYQTLFGLASRRDVAGGLMQAYAASGPYLTKLEIAGLERAPAPAGLYLTDVQLRFPDGKVTVSDADLARAHKLGISFPIDGVYNFTRTPDLWFWMMRHYRAQSGTLADGIVGLVRDDSRASRISLDTESLGLLAQTSPVGERSSVTDLGAVKWPADFDFLRLRLTVRYGVSWKIRKPEKMQAEITWADGNKELRWFIVQPNVSNDIWLYPWNAADLAKYLDADEGNWRTTPRPAVTHLRIVATPLDFVSVPPQAILLEAADAIKVHIRP